MPEPELTAAAQIKEKRRLIQQLERERRKRDCPWHERELIKTRIIMLQLDINKLEDNKP